MLPDPVTATSRTRTRRLERPGTAAAVAMDRTPAGITTERAVDTLSVWLMVPHNWNKAEIKQCTLEI